MAYVVYNTDGHKPTRRALRVSERAIHSHYYAADYNATELEVAVVLHTSLLDIRPTFIDRYTCLRSKRPPKEMQAWFRSIAAGSVKLLYPYSAPFKILK
jgi:hypothetical protein